MNSSNQNSQGRKIINLALGASEKNTVTIDGEWFKKQFRNAVNNYFAPFTWVYKNLKGQRCSLWSCYKYD